MNSGPQRNASAGIAERTRRKITRRLMPFLFVLYIISYLDRVNLGYASLEMTRELGFSNEVFGFGAGIFSSDISSWRFREGFWLNSGAHASGSGE
jgi:sugar phosphate permease